MGRIMPKLNYQMTLIFSMVLAMTSYLHSQENETVTIQPDTTLIDSNIVLNQFNKLELSIVTVTGRFDFIFIPQNPDSVQIYAQKNDYRLLINGSFFDGLREQATHAGWLKIFGKELANVKRDRQLSHIVKYSPVNGNFEFVDYINFKPDSSTDRIEFQTGPLVIEKNLITDNYLKKSINGMGKYWRTLLGTTFDGTFYFITVRKKVALDELARFLRSTAIFAGKKLTVINLDGGPSVALFVEKYPQFNFNVNAQLPLLLGVK